MGVGQIGVNQFPFNPGFNPGGLKGAFNGCSGL
jgi:hypothetical protein